MAMPKTDRNDARRRLSGLMDEAQMLAVEHFAGHEGLEVQAFAIKRNRKGEIRVSVRAEIVYGDETPRATY